jgi:hypothetical protein
MIRKGANDFGFRGCMIVDCRVLAVEEAAAISQASEIRDSIVRRVKTQVMQMLGLSRSKYGSGVRLEEWCGESLAALTGRDKVLNTPDKQQSSNSVL